MLYIKSLHINLISGKHLPNLIDESATPHWSILDATKIEEQSKISLILLQEKKLKVTQLINTHVSCRSLFLGNFLVRKKTFSFAFEFIINEISVLEVRRSLTGPN